MKTYSNSIERYINSKKAEIEKLDTEIKLYLMAELNRTSTSGRIKTSEEISGEIYNVLSEFSLRDAEKVVQNRIDKSFKLDGFKNYIDPNLTNTRNLQGEYSSFLWYLANRYAYIYMSNAFDVNTSTLEDKLNNVIKSDVRLNYMGLNHKFANIIGFLIFSAFFDDITDNFFELIKENKVNLLYVNYYSDCSELCINVQNKTYYGLYPVRGLDPIESAMFQGYSIGGVGHRYCRHIIAPFTGDELEMNPLSKDEMRANAKERDRQVARARREREKQEKIRLENARDEYIN